MEAILIESTDETPKIVCNIQGKIEITGKSLTEDPLAFYNPIHNWIANIETENIIMEMSLEYMNTASSKQIFTLIELAKKNKVKKQLTINWYYEANDEDTIDTGKEFESLLEIPFNFIIQS